MKPWQRTLLALVVLGGIATWVGLKELKPIEEKKDKIWSAKAAAVAKFEVRDLTTGVGLACAKGKDSVWRITAPADLEADTEACDLAARHLAEPEIERKLDPPDDLSVFGLKEPRIRAAFTDTAGTTHALLLGIKTPTDSGYFAIEEGGKIPYVVATWSADNFRKTVNDLRQKTLMRLEPAEVRRLVIRRKEGGTVELARVGTEAWKLLQPVQAAADRFTIDALLGDLKGLKGQDLLEEASAYSRYRLDQPTAEVVVYTGSGSGQTLTLARPDLKKDEAYASSTRLPFTWRLAGSAILATITKPVADFRDRLLLQLDKEAMTGAEITVAGRKHVLVPARDGKWKVTEPANAAPAEAETTDMLFEIGYLRAEEFTDDHPKSAVKYGLASPAADVLIRATVDGKPGVYRYKLGLRTGDRVACSFGDAPSVFGVRKDLLDKVERFADKVRAVPAPAAAPPTPAKDAPAKKPK